MYFLFHSFHSFLDETAPVSVTATPSFVSQYYQTPITPIVFSVDGFASSLLFDPPIPSSLHYDSQTNSITGSIDVPGRYTFTVIASNSKGSVSSSFTILINGMISLL